MYFQPLRTTCFLNWIVTMMMTATATPRTLAVSSKETGISPMRKQSPSRASSMTPWLSWAQPDWRTSWPKQWMFSRRPSHLLLLLECTSEVLRQSWHTCTFIHSPAIDNWSRLPLVSSDQPERELVGAELHLPGHVLKISPWLHEED